MKIFNTKVAIIFSKLFAGKFKVKDHKSKTKIDIFHRSLSDFSELYDFFIAGLKKKINILEFSLSSD